VARSARKPARPRPRAADESGDDAPSGPRPFWAGTISFGLVSVPVNLYSLVRSGGVALRMLAPDGTPVQRRYACPKDGRDVDYEDLVRGYEVAEDEYVVVTDEELESVAPRKTRDIDLRQFVDVSEIDPIFFDRTYVLTPSGDTTKPYRLLAEVMEREKKAGIATAVMRNKEYLIAIFAEAGILRAETLRFADEVRTPKQTGLPDPREAPRKLVAAFDRAIKSHEKAGVAESELVDERERKLRELIERKRKRGEDMVESAEAEAEGEGEDGAEPEGDALFEMIRRSLAAARDGRAPDSRAAKPGAVKSGSRAQSRGAPKRNPTRRASSKSADGAKRNGRHPASSGPRRKRS
jgi:DNA end-binding protein Ku